jgi:tetrapyrrole methylase family protein / MazG family protein
MQELDDLDKVLDRLLAPDGCPWDREQTLESMRASLQEETSEVIEAINFNDAAQLKEELGDLFFNVLFLCKLAEKEFGFTPSEVLKHITQKLIRRHPHIFGEAQAATTEDVLKQWESIKQQEKKQVFKSVLDDIPQALPLLAKVQKNIKKMKKTRFSLSVIENKDIQDEEELGRVLFGIVAQAQEKGLDAEQALAKFLALQTKAFREWESSVVCSPKFGPF